VYTVYDALVGKFTGTYTSIPVNLNQSLYIVQTGTAKLLVTRNGGDGGTVQIQQAPAITTKAAPAMEIPAVNTQAGTIRIY
jgi:hypothetical protein